MDPFTILTLIETILAGLAPIAQTVLTTIEKPSAATVAAHAVAVSHLSNASAAVTQLKSSLTPPAPAA